MWTWQCNDTRFNLIEQEVQAKVEQRDERLLYTTGVMIGTIHSIVVISQVVAKWAELGTSIDARSFQLFLGR